MFQATMSNSTLSSKEVSNSLPSFNPLLLQNTNILSSSQPQPPPPKKLKKKRSLPGNPDPDAEVIALSPKSLLATNRFVCEVCNKGFQRDQNLQLHRRGHNLPWKLKQRSNKDVIRKKAYVCPEPTCVHHHPSRALGDLTGIKKHFCRKHGEKKFKCEKCSKIYAVQSDWKAHSKICGTREYRCDCGTLFSRKDSFITHRAFCDALAEESARLSTNPFTNPNSLLPQPTSITNNPLFLNHLPTTSHNNLNSSLFPFSSPNSISLSSPPWDPQPPHHNSNPNNNNNNNNPLMHIKSETLFSPPPFFQTPPSFSKGLLSSPFATDKNHVVVAMSAPAPFLSATALLQKATTVQAQQAQAQALMAGFDELGATFRTTATSDGLMDPTPLLESTQQLPPQSSSTTTPIMDDHHDHSDQHNNQHQQDHFNTMLGLASSLATWHNKDEGFTRDFLGLTAGDDHHHSHHHHYTNAGPNGGNNSNKNNNNNGTSASFNGDNNHHGEVVGDMLKFTNGLHYDRDNSSSFILKPHHHYHHNNQVDGFGFESPATATATATDARWG